MRGSRDIITREEHGRMLMLLKQLETNANDRQKKARRDGVGLRPLDKWEIDYIPMCMLMSPKGIKRFFDAMT